SNLPQFTIRLNKVALYKLKYIAQMHERSANKETILLIKNHIAAYEASNGAIKVPPEIIEGHPYEG
ncbi:hypothetical protein LJC27_07985, partial [Christensenellaceae bacterium OttesenSCG-928-M15]|nr:hypothetical protein [Christensenellaceae bacterium OttesenSCG-928-M15]